ncbi:MAG: twin-arginine translocase subunit TatB, partial [Spirochaetes bacterium]
MFSIGMQELILILVIALLVVGPKKIPEMARSIGKAMKEFQKAANDVKESVNMESILEEEEGEEELKPAEDKEEKSQTNNKDKEEKQSFEGKDEKESDKNKT